MLKHKFHSHRDTILVAVFALLCLILYFVPTGYEARLPENAVRCKGEVIETEDSQMQQFGLIKKGHQHVKLRLLDGPFAGQEVSTDNQLMGRMDLDKVFAVGDRALVVLSLGPDGEIVFVNAQDHYRLGLEIWLLVLFVLLLVIYGSWTGAKALLSFLFAALVIWKLVVPLMLEGWDPVWLALGIVGLLTGVVIFLVAGLTRKGLSAFLGAAAGVLTSCLLSFYFTRHLHLHGAVMPFAETLLYAGYAHIDITKVYMAAVFFASSGAVMDLAMDVSASLDEVVQKKPDVGGLELLKSGLRVGRAVVGTMTTTLLLAYSGGYISLLMAFMAQGIPLANMFNMIYVAAEITKTLVGSFGLVTVAPFTAIIGAFIYSRPKAPEKAQSTDSIIDREARKTPFISEAVFYPRPNRSEHSHSAKPVHSRVVQTKNCLGHPKEGKATGGGSPTAPFPVFPRQPNLSNLPNSSNTYPLFIVVIQGGPEA